MSFQASSLAGLALGWEVAALGWAGLAELSEDWPGKVKGASRPLPVSLTVWINVVK